jgi:hypothetical protein
MAIFQPYDLRLRRRQLRGCLCHIELTAQAGVKSGPRQRQGFLLRRDIVLGDGGPLLKAAHVDVIARHLGEQGDEGVAQILLGRSEVRVGGLNGAPHAAEAIDFRTRIETGLEQVALQVRRQRDTAHRHTRCGVAPRPGESRTIDISSSTLGRITSSAKASSARVGSAISPAISFMCQAGKP